jgi:hypothetical protein
MFLTAYQVVWVQEWMDLRLELHFQVAECGQER